MCTSKSESYRKGSNKKGKKVFSKDYYIGLDVGTGSVGWAVTDSEFNIPNFNGKAMWGVRIFDEAQTAAERRLHRTARRNLERKKQRIQLLQYLMADEVSKVDEGFYQRLASSAFYEEDKQVKGRFSLFNDEDFTDTDYHRKYPTIYHLRHELATSKEPHDVRLVYLALHHILKHRGHFLLQGDFSDVNELELRPLWDVFCEMVSLYLNVDLNVSDLDAVGTVLSESKNITTKKKGLKDLITVDKEHKKIGEYIISLLAGKVNLAKLFTDDELDDAEKKEVDFAGSFSEEVDIYASILGDRFSVLSAAKAIYDWAILKNLLGGKGTLSEAKIAVYEQHKVDLRMLKEGVRKLCDETMYPLLFGIPKGKEIYNYSSYIGNYSEHGKNSTNSGSLKGCSDEKFYDFLEKRIFIGKKDIWEKEYPVLWKRYQDKELLPKQKVRDNGVLPYQIHKIEFVKILENASTYLPFLNAVDEDGYVIKDKILSLLTFRIPYYVGPINTYHGKFAWAVRKADATGPVRPWNFEEHIDLEASATKFIRRMTNKCTYLPTEDVLPKNSLLYSRFVLLNELNNLTIHGEKITTTEKQLIFNRLFMRNKKVSLKKIVELLITEGFYKKGTLAKEDIKGIDGEFQSTLGSYIDFKKIFGVDILTERQEAIAEDCILNITLFGEERKMLLHRIKESFGSELTEKQMQSISKLSYSGWGRLSKKVLLDIKDSKVVEGKPLNIMTAMYEAEGNPNFMQLLSNDYTYMKQIEDINAEVTKDESLSQMLDNMYVSPSVKRAIHQTIGIVKEIRKIAGKDPKEICIEMARGAQEKERTKSRKKQLEDLYKACKTEAKKWLGPDGIKELEDGWKALSDAKLRQDKLFLYYLQMGHSMYSGEKIDLHNLGAYDIDHIYPQALVKDDSLGNRVLVEKVLNSEKSDIIPLPEKIRMNPACIQLWKYLEKMGLLSSDKAYRLRRTTPFSDGELEGFINRQLVETRQSTKALAQILSTLFPNTDIVYVKAGNVSEFRRGVNDLQDISKKYEVAQARMQDNQFIKVRSVNNHHHAKDAYLNIVVGTVYHHKFTKDVRRFIAERKNATSNGSKHLYSLHNMYKGYIEGVWMPSKYNMQTGELVEGTMETVRKYMNRNNVLVTRALFEKSGQIADLNPLKKGLGQISQKKEGPLNNIEKYGGYNSGKCAYFFIVERTLKGKVSRTIESMLIKDANSIKSNEDLLEYCKTAGMGEDVRVIVPKVVAGCVFEKNGFRMRLGKKSNDSIHYYNVNELILSVKFCQYIKQLEKVVQRLKDEVKGDEILFGLTVTKEKNKELYNEFIRKFKEGIFSNSDKYSSKVDDLVNHRELFMNLEVENQAKILMEILHMFDTSTKGGDLKPIGLKNSVLSVIAMTKNITDNKDLYIVHTSPTGLFERKEKLNDL